MVITQAYTPDPDQDIIEAVPARSNDIIVEDVPSKRSLILYRSYQIIWFFLGVIETLLIFRFVLKFIGANTISGFTEFVYALSLPFAGPFLETLPSSTSGNSVAEWSTLIAIIVYIVFAYGIIEIIQLLTPVKNTPAHYVTKRTRYAL